MIDIAPLVTRIRAACPLFSNRVGGTMGLAAALANKGYDLPVPYAFVVPTGGEDLNVLYGQDEVLQDVRERFTVIVCVDNQVSRGDDGGVSSLTANTEVVSIQQALESAFLGWRPSDKYDLVRYGRDRHIAMDNVRLWHEFEWMVSYVQTPAVDGAEGTTNAKVNGIDLDDWLEGDDYPAGLSGKLTNLYEVVNVRKPPADMGKSVDDHFPPAIGNPNTPVLNLGQIQAHRALGEHTLLIQVAEGYPYLTSPDGSSYFVSPDGLLYLTSPNGSLVIENQFVVKTAKEIGDMIANPRVFPPLDPDHGFEVEPLPPES